MSAVRRIDRRVNRNNLASPYARPLKSNRVHPQKKSLWSLSGLISFLNPFGSHIEPEDSDSGPSDGEIEQGSPPRRFSPPLQPFPPPPTPLQPQSSSNSSWPSGMNGPNAASGHTTEQPFSLNVHSPASSGPSLAKNLEPVTRFLVEKAGQPLNEFEAAGIVDYIQKNVQGSTLVPDKPEPFRFSTSPSRSVSPNQTQGIGNIQTSRKTLSRNPNGPYRWQGAGSSRPRNRYQSPGFAPRPQQHRIKLSPPKTPVTTDTKRRRVGDEAGPSTPQRPTVPSTSMTSHPSSIPESIPPLRQATGSSTTFLNGRPTTSTLAPAPPVTPKANGVQPRIRTGGLPMKPTTPAIPSPLRQTWKESDSPPQPSPPSRPTRAADFMTELIKGVTPTKKPDVSNPYQTASPVKPPPPVRKPVAKRAKLVPKPAEQQPKEQEPEMSAQAIIEATVPKGTKRSRPPPEMEKPVRVEEVLDSEPLVPTLNGFMHIRSDFDVAEAVTVTEGGESSPKRRKTPLASLSSSDEGICETSTSKAAIRPTEIIEPADDNIQINDKQAQIPSAMLSPPSSTKPLFAIPKISAPKEPSKLRYSFRADKVEVKGADAAPTPPLPALFAAPSLPSSRSTTTPEKLSSKEEALAMSVDELPRYTFPVATTSYPARPSLSAARCAVVSLAVSSLPTYDFTTVIAPVHAMNGFNWTAAGLKAPTTPAQMWKCSVCELQNPADAKEKCTICDAPRPMSTISSSPSPVSVPTQPSCTPVTTTTQFAPVKGFDWSAAGLVPPPKPQSGTWICSVCSLSNSASATDKCSICDAPR